MNDKITKDASRVKRERKIKRIAKLVLLILILLLLIIYLVVGIIYNNGNFSITLDKNLYFEKDIIIYSDVNYKIYRSELYAESIDWFDNISYKWLPDDIDEHDGSHNGENYIAYSFYLENIGTKMTSDCWSEIIIDDVIKNVDEAVRVRVYKNGEPITYAKMGANGKPEKGTTPFKSDDVVALEHIQGLSPGTKIRYTIVIWLEGSDPECTENILGGEIKLHMNFNSEFIDE